MTGMIDRTLTIGLSQLGIGRGVFAACHLLDGVVFERSPVLILSPEDRKTLDKTALFDFYYDWTDGAAAIALGFGSLFNHSYAPNATYRKNVDSQTIEFVALQAIAEGDEIFINYNGDPDSRAPVWFDVIDVSD